MRPPNLFPSTRIRQVLFVAFWVNLVVAAAKTFWGYRIQSMGMRADGTHSFLDASSSLIGWLGVYLATGLPDSTHPYGHRKFETFATFCISLLILLSGLQILMESIGHFQEVTAPQVTPASVAVLLLTFFQSLWLSRWEETQGKALKSAILIADAHHTRSDLWASASVMVGLAVSRMGYPIIDPVVGVIIAVIIGRAGVRILGESLNVLMDGAQMDPQAIRGVVMKIDGIRECHAIRTRGVTHYVYMDLHIHVDPQMPIEEAHRRSHQVEFAVIKAFPNVKDVVVHIEPHLENLEDD